MFENQNHTKKVSKNVARFACETILSDFETMCQSQTRMCEISGEKEVTILKMHRNIFFTDRKEVHHSPKENQETLCFSILPPSEFFIEYIFVPVINSKQYHVRQRIENLICQSDLILHSLSMLESKKKICLALITIYHRPKLILHICVKVMIFHCKSC